MGSIIDKSYGSCEQQQQDKSHFDDDLFHRDTFFPSLIEAHARLQPLRVCLVSTSATYDFASLWNLVVINARRFSQNGVNQSSRVAVVSESSPAAIVALLAVLKTGAVVVPLGSSLPESRIQSIGRLGGLTHFVGLTTLSQQINLPGADRLSLDLELREPTPLTELESISEVDPQAPAIVIFTSGSTGEPKGVVHSHTSLSTMAFAVGNALRLAPDERNFLFPSFGWAVNIIDSFSTLVAGACLCMPTETEKSQGLEDAICRFDATRTTLPSSVLGIMEPGTVPSLTSVVLAGEPMRLDLVRDWSPHIIIYWNYGSSETLMVLAGNAAEQDSDALNAGYALPSCCCYMVDDNGDKLPPGQAGELIVEGHTNFMGYLREGKVEIRECGRNGRLIVHTGDLFGQDNGNAALVYRGRIDSQLKISGQRFEPQEIENSLWPALTGVKELAVTVAALRGNMSGPALVALVVLEHQDSTEENSPLARLRCGFESLVQTLPPYMVPIGALEVDKLPKLPNGKLNRKGLVALAEQRASTDLMDLRPPQEDQMRTHDISLTTQVATVWATTLELDIDDINPSSSFFLLGGNSLYAMRACKELRQVGILMSISDFFLHPTLGAMVHLIAARHKLRTEEAEQPSHNRNSIPEVTASNLREMAARQCGVDEGLIENVYSCTPMQAALMTLSEVQEGAYIAEHTFRLPASWSKTCFIQAWMRTVEATPMLRSRIVRHRSGRLYNVTMKFNQDENLPLKVFPHPFPMTCGSQLFLHCLDMNENNDGWIWRWRIHHCIYDRWSTNLILQIIHNEYHRQETTRSTPFSLFADAVTEQQLSEKAKGFWHSRLESFTGSIFPQLPLDHFICSASSSLAFESTMQRRRSATTQATSIQAALALLISKVHGESDVVFGMTVHGRAWSECPDAETVVGPAIATIPVRIQLDSHMQIHAFLEHVQTQAALSSDYEHYSLQNIKSIGPGSASAASFTTLLIVQSDFESGRDRGPGCIIEISTDSSDSYVDYPLVVECFPHSGGIKVKMLYDPAVLSAWNVQMMANQFEQLLHEIECNTDPSTPIMDLELLSTEDVADVVRTSTNCGELIELRECLHERIFAKATHWEAEVALHGWDANYTYAELHKNARVLAAGLSQELGGPPGRIIPICYKKSAAAVVAMLATLSAGHAFLMLDPALPAQRIQYMLEAVNADRIICSSDTIRLVQDVGAQPVNIEDIMNDTSPDLECLADTQSSPDAPAYCMFTSGSTGLPKGVLLLHKQVTSALEAQCSAGLYPRKAHILQFSSYGFDTCIADIFATLLSGGCICVPKDDDRLLRISDNINDFSATAIDLTPSVARMIQPDDVPGLEILRLGGEPMHHHHIQTWASRCNLQNTYGPTECCVQCTFVDHIDETMSPTIIGKGIGCNTWVVDPQNHNRLMPLGAMGELAIQGPGVASGYINNPEKSEACFLSKAPWLETYNIECNFPTYLTGDLVKFNEQGDLVYVGRRDSQLKIRGQRVELEEIEHILQQDLLTKQAIVCYPTTGALASQLVALLEPSQCDPSSSSTSPVDKQQLPRRTVDWMERSAQKAAEFLPYYMVPGVYLLADKTLLMSSGKLDRQSMQRRLEQITTDQLDSLKAYQRGKTPDATSSLPTLPESIISPIVEQIQYLLSWRSGDQNVTFNIRHTFSGIGLDSITIVPLLKWVNETYQACMDMQTLLRLETVYELACYLNGIETRAANQNGFGKDHEQFHEIISKGVNQLCNDKNSSEPPRKVLLTGGSSLVGLHILLALLHRFPSTRVVVLTRCVNAAVGKDRIIEKLKLLSSWEDTLRDRIEIWPGDLSSGQLALASSHLSQLRGDGDVSTHVDCVIHNAAAVDWFEGFQTLKKINVDAALHLVEHVRDSTSIKRLVYISGGPQWDPHETEEAILQGSGLGNAFTQSNAYGQTKMIASTIIQRAAARDARLAAKVAIIRPALIVGSSTDGVPNIDDFIWRVVMGCYTIRAFPREPEGSWVYLCGADQFADLVIESRSSSPRVCETRVENGLPVEKFWEVVNQELGENLECLDYDIWLRRLEESISAHNLRSSENHPCHTVFHMLESSPEVLGAPAPRSVDPKWHQQTIENSARVVARNIRYMADVGCFSKAESVWSVRVFNRSKVRLGINGESIGKSGDLGVGVSIRA